MMLSWYQPELVQGEDVGIDPFGLTIEEHHGQTGLSRVLSLPGLIPQAGSLPQLFFASCLSSVQCFMC